MILLNFAHPLGAGQAAVMEIDCWIDPVRALGPQVVALVDGVGFVASGVADAAAVD